MGIRKAPLDCGTSCVKFLVVIGNVLFLLLGIALVSLGIYTKMDIEKNHLPSGRLDVVPLAIIAVGCAITVIGCVGLCAAHRESRFLLGLYLFILLLLLVGQLGSVIFGFVEKGNLPTILEKLWYNETSPEIRQKIEARFNCCGFTSPICANDTIPSNSTRTCKEVLDAFLSSKLNVVVGVAAGFFVIQSFWMGLSYCLCSGIPEHKDDEREALLEDARNANRTYPTKSLHNSSARHSSPTTRN